MAKMIPAYISSGAICRSERIVFNALKDDPDAGDWIILHSLNIPGTRKRLYGEIDFVVLAPGLGIFCLEVKGGKVERVDGVWKVSDKSGNEYNSTIGPIKQAQDGMYGLIDSVKMGFGKNSRENKFLYSFGIVFTDIAFNIKNIEIEEWHIYDKSCTHYSLADFIKNLSRKSIEKYSTTKWFNSINSIPKLDDIKKISNFIRPDFQILVKPKERLAENEKIINQFTEEQYNCLDYLEDNKRLLFQGAAGTGKTMIALESAKRSICNGEKTLVLCFNKLLGEWISGQLNDYKSEGSFYSGSYHDFLERIAEKNISNIEKNSHYYEKQLPLNAIEAIGKNKEYFFDKIIVDEGQDIIREEYLNVLDKLLVDGLVNGKWEFYCDFERQNLFSNHIQADEMVGLLDKRAGYVKYKLKVNCRNSKQIAEEISKIFGFNTLTGINNIDGIPVKYLAYDDRKEELELLEKVLLDMRKQRILPSNITVLSPYKYHKSCLDKINKGLFSINNISEEHSLFLKSNNISFATIYKFKGMENNYIIIVDIGGEVDKEYFNNLLYVGMSRAKYGLVVLINENMKSKLGIEA